MWEAKSPRRVAMVAGAMLVVAAAHFFTDPMEHQLHNVFFKVAFVPLIFAGLWFGVRGGLLASSVMAAFSLVHYFTQLQGHEMHHPLWSIVADMVLYVVVAFVWIVPEASLVIVKVSSLPRALDPMATRDHHDGFHAIVAALT